MKQKIVLNKDVERKLKYGVEFFHIYIDEKINKHHMKSIEYLKTMKDVWEIDSQLILLIDNYNPTKKVTDVDTILKFLQLNDVEPDYWAFEASLSRFADEVLEGMTDIHLRKNYSKYIDDHKKLPCSLLTATWYLLRLGALEGYEEVINPVGKNGLYVPVDRLINILPFEYKAIELKVLKIIKSSQYGVYADKIQDLFYSSKQQHKLDLF